MSTETLDLSHLGVSEAERHVGHLLRQALSESSVGVFILKSADDGLFFLNAAVFLRKLPTDELVQFLISAGFAEDQVIDLIAALDEGEEDGDPTP
jgi:hypothetical protein